MTIDYDSLNFPVFHTSFPEHKPLSMDEYDKFNIEDLQNSFDMVAYRKEKELLNVNVMFTIP